MGERGSALMLMPAAVLVFVVLGAIAVDFAVAFLGEREVSNAAAAAANDAVGAALDLDRLYEDDALRLDPAAAERVGRAAVEAAGLDDLDDVAVRVDVAPDAPTVTVTVSARVRYVFSKALPGGPDGVPVQATATATAEEDD
jgi:Flp pilus assembly protein TadG